MLKQASIRGSKGVWLREQEALGLNWAELHNAYDEESSSSFFWTIVSTRIISQWIFLSICYAPRHYLAYVICTGQAHHPYGICMRCLTTQSLILKSGEHYECDSWTRWLFFPAFLAWHLCPLLLLSGRPVDVPFAIRNLWLFLSGILRARGDLRVKSSAGWHFLFPNQTPN